MRSFMIVLDHYCSSDKIAKNELGVACSADGGGERRTEFWWGNLKESLLGRPRHRWEDNIKMVLQEVGCGGVWPVLDLLRIGTGGGDL
jgi:hypothetical protein